jgi:hypothetical protein
MQVSSKQALRCSLIRALPAVSVLGLIGEAAAQSASTKSDGSAVFAHRRALIPRHEGQAIAPQTLVALLCKLN